MSYDLLEQLRRAKVSELDDDRVAFINSLNQGDLEERIRKAMDAYTSLGSGSELLDEVHLTLFENETRLAEVNAKVIGIERALRLGPEAGKRITTEAREYSKNHMDAFAPFLNDVEGIDDE